MKMSSREIKGKMRGNKTKKRVRANYGTFIRSGAKKTLSFFFKMRDERRKLKRFQISGL